jgi:hypothetical protein
MRSSTLPEVPEVEWSAPDRFLRQAGLVPRQRVAELTATVVGCGAIGRQVALQLAALGVPRLVLVDFDQVELTNVTTQGYLTRQLGQLKVEALAESVREIDPAVAVEAIPERYAPRQPLSPVLFCAVDSITVRAALWKGERRRSEFWCDGRMLGEVLRVLTVTALSGTESYARSLFSAGEAQPGSCTARSTIYTAQIAAGLMLHQFTRWLRGLPVDADLSLNLLASELGVG